MADSLESLAASLLTAGEDVNDAAFEEVQDAAKVIRDHWRAQWAGFKSAPYLARAVTHDVFRLGDSISAEIGPDKQRKQGALGNLVEWGSVNNPPHPAGAESLKRGADGLEERIADRLVELLERDRG